MKPEPVTCGKCGYEFQSRSPHPQCRKCRSYDVLYVSMLSRAKLQSVRKGRDAAAEDMFGNLDLGETE